MGRKYKAAYKVRKRTVSMVMVRTVKSQPKTSQSSNKKNQSDNTSRMRTTILPSSLATMESCFGLVRPHQHGVLNFHKSHNAPVLPPKFGRDIVFDFSWDIFKSQEKSKTPIMQNLGGQKMCFMGLRTENSQLTRRGVILLTHFLCRAAT